MKRLAMLLVVFGLFLTVYCFWFYRPAWRLDPFLAFRPTGNSSATPAFDYWVFPGDQGLHFYNQVEGEKSVKGLRSLHDLRADIIVLGYTGDPADGSPPYRVYDNISVRPLRSSDKWSDSIELKRTEGSQGSIKVDVEVASMPNDADLWGRDARLLVSARIEFPQMVDSQKYLDRNVSYRGEARFRFAARAEKERYDILFDEYQRKKTETDAYNDRARKLYRIIKPLGGLLGLVLIASAVVLWRLSDPRKTGALPPDN